MTILNLFLYFLIRGLSRFLLVFHILVFHFDYKTLKVKIESQIVIIGLQLHSFLIMLSSLHPCRYVFKHILQINIFNLTY